MSTVSLSLRISNSRPVCLSAPLLAIVAVALFCTGCHDAPKLTTQEAQGKHLYQVRCAHCHEDNDLGLKKVPPDLHGVFDKSTLPSGAPATDAQVKQVVLGGKGMMPAFTGRFDEAQMSALLAYLHTGLR
jgi:mono/diheme cytochrome c family protein